MNKRREAKQEQRKRDRYSSWHLCWRWKNDDWWSYLHQTKCKDIWGSQIRKTTPFGYSESSFLRPRVPCNHILLEYGVQEIWSYPSQPPYKNYLLSLDTNNKDSPQVQVAVDIWGENKKTNSKEKRTVHSAWSRQHIRSCTICQGISDFSKAKLWKKEREREKGRDRNTKSPSLSGLNHSGRNVEPFWNCSKQTIYSMKRTQCFRSFMNLSWKGLKPRPEGLEGVIQGPNDMSSIHVNIIVPRSLLQILIYRFRIL